MKNIFVILTTLLLFQTIAFGYKKVYIDDTPYRTYVPYGYCCPGGNFIRYPYNSYYVQRNVVYPASKSSSRRLREIKRRQRMKNNKVSWLNKNNSGGLTGYSVPINKDIYKQMGITPYDPNIKTRPNSPTCNQELYSMPAGDEMYYKNGKKYSDLRGVSGRTGVTIIYD